VNGFKLMIWTAINAATTVQLVTLNRTEFNNLGFFATGWHVFVSVICVVLLGTQPKSHAKILDAMRATPEFVYQFADLVCLLCVGVYVAEGRWVMVAAFIVIAFARHFCREVAKVEGAK